MKNIEIRQSYEPNKARVSIYWHTLYVTQQFFGQFLWNFALNIRRQLSIDWPRKIQCVNCIGYLSILIWGPLGEIGATMWIPGSGASKPFNVDSTIVLKEKLKTVCLPYKRSSVTSSRGFRGFKIPKLTQTLG